VSTATLDETECVDPLRIINGGQQEDIDMKSGIENRTVAGFHVPLAPAAGRYAMKRNFILQQGFEDPAPAVCSLQYSALMFQPKIVLIGIAAGILLQSQAVFAGLGALLWWSAMFPKLNPFRALYNQTIGSRPGAFHLDPSPAPRRAAETEAGIVALTCALLIYAGFGPAAGNRRRGARSAPLPNAVALE
jgi:hypothetical protein